MAKKIQLIVKTNAYLWFNGENRFLEFKGSTGTCCLTSHRLINVEHEKGKPEQGNQKD